MAGTFGNHIVVVTSKPVACPICGGCGSVEHNFYTQMTSGTSANRVTCQTCNGKGTVMATETVTRPA